VRASGGFQGGATTKSEQKLLHSAERVGNAFFNGGRNKTVGGLLMNGGEPKAGGNGLDARHGRKATLWWMGVV